MTLLSSKNLILFCEGTEGFSRSDAPSNVMLMFNCLAYSSDKDQQTAFYHMGPGREGTGFKFLKIGQILGNALGLGSAKRCVAFYRFLCEHYKPGDKINLIGFSRGAYIVRTVADLVSRYGIVNPRNANVGDDFHIITETIFRHYCTDNRFNCSFDPNMETKFSKFLHLEEPVTINFMGLWDTVGAMGGPDDLMLSRMVRIIFRQSYPDFGDNYIRHTTKHVAHALAVDDHRKSFSPKLWLESHGNNAIVEQMWFAGSHSDVGGGYADNGLSAISLDWMISKAAHAGIIFDESKVAKSIEGYNPLGKLHNPRTGFGRLQRRKVRDVLQISSSAGIIEPVFHKTVDERRRNGTYTPSNIPKKLSNGNVR